MKRIHDFLKKISEEKGYDFFIYEKTHEIWVSGYKDGVKFDLVVKPVRKYQVKVIYEKPDERRVALFNNKNDAYNRLKKIFAEEVQQQSEEQAVETA